MMFEGVNDIGSASSADVADQLIEAYQQIISTARESNIPIFGATITPIGGSSYGSTTSEDARQKVNEWIRSSVNGTDVGFDGIADFDEILSDPNNPGQLKPEYNSGDSLHPSVAGYQAIADQFPVDIFS
jgi:lysophospholipase L1-like esterase